MSNTFENDITDYLTSNYVVYYCSQHHKTIVQIFNVNFNSEKHSSHAPYHGTTTDHQQIKVFLAVTFCPVRLAFQTLNTIFTSSKQMRFILCTLQHTLVI